MSKPAVTKGLYLFPLIMLIVGAIDSIRNLPATALFGSALIFFFVFSAMVFLIPTAWISVDLAAKFPGKGGVYQWSKLAFGSNIAFLSIWLQWINTMVWFPTILSFIAGTAVYLFDPQLANNKLYLILVILSVFWGLTFISLKGIEISAKVNSFCAVIGTAIPMLFIIGLGAVWLFSNKHLQIQFGFADLFPSLSHSDNWISLTAIMTSFLGMELSAVHLAKVHQPQKTFPKAMIIATVIVLFTMIFGSLAIAFVLPVKQINLVDGLLQAFTAFLQAFHISWLLPVLAVLILTGSFGSMINWVIAPAKGLLQAAEDGYLPAFLCQKNQCGVEKNLLIMQALLVSVICLAFLLMPSVNGSYWLLSDLSTQLYMLMYVLLFLSAIAAAIVKTPAAKGLIPGGKKGVMLISGLGLTGCLITLVVGFFPPSDINVGTKLHYETVFTLGMITMVLPVTIFYWYKRRTSQ